MSRCDKINDETLVLLAFEEAPPEAAAHLAQCPECRQRLDEARQVRTAVAGLLPAAPPARTVRDLKLAAVKVARGRRRRRLAIWWLLPTAAAAALVLIVVGGYRTEPTPPAADVAWAAPLNLDGIETDLDRQLGEIGLPDEGASADVGDTDGLSDPETDLELAAITPSADEEMLRPAAWDAEEQSLDQLEVALVHLEKDLGLEPAGAEPAKGD